MNKKILEEMKKIDSLIKSEEDLNKNIGFLTFPKLNEPSPQTKPMATTNVKGLAREGTKDLGNIAFNVSKNPEKGLPANKRQVKSSVFSVKDPKKFNAYSDHETQHSVFSNIAQKHGNSARWRVIATTLSRLPTELRDHIKDLHLAHGVPETALKSPEESISYLHNYLQDPVHRQNIHNNMKLTDPMKQRQSHQKAKQAWNMLRSIGQVLHPEDVGINLNKSENYMWNKKQILEEMKKMEESLFKVDPQAKAMGLHITETPENNWHSTGTHDVAQDSLLDAGFQKEVNPRVPNSNRMAFDLVDQQRANPKMSPQEKPKYADTPFVPIDVENANSSVDGHWGDPTKGVGGKSDRFQSNEFWSQIRDDINHHFSLFDNHFNKRGLNKTIEIDRPVGWIENGKVKVQSKDIRSGAPLDTHWHQGRAGMIMGPNGHPVSAYKQGDEE